MRQGRGRGVGRGGCSSNAFGRSKTPRAHLQLAAARLVRACCAQRRRPPPPLTRVPLPSVPPGCLHTCVSTSLAVRSVEAVMKCVPSVLICMSMTCSPQEGSGTNQGKIAVRSRR